MDDEVGKFFPSVRYRLPDRTLTDGTEATVLNLCFVLVPIVLLPVQQYAVVSQSKRAR